MRQLLESCDTGRVMLDVQAESLEGAFTQMVRRLAELNMLPTESVDSVVAGLKQNEEKGSTAIGQSLAVPHLYLDGIPRPMVAIARLRQGINAGAPDGAPTRFVFLLIGPSGATEDHLDALANVARLMSDDEFRYLALHASDAGELREAIEARYSGELAAAHHTAVGEGMKHSGRPFGGIVADIKRRLPHYVQDFKDGLDAKCLGSSLFLFFACLAPAIIFGGLMHGATDGAIGAVEMIVATAFCGFAYALVSGQPLIILGGTGPMLVFTAILYEYCSREGIPFLPAYAWVGFWTGLILVILAIFDASVLMRYFTRFTDEIFAALISIIFVYEAVFRLVEIFQRAEAESLGYDIALLSLLLALGTYFIASSLTAFRKSHLLVPTAREFLADFGPTIAILAMTAVAVLARNEIPLDPLPAPDSFGTTIGRPWLVPFLDLSQGMVLLAIVPALLCSVLVFLDQNITARLVNSRDNNLHKGEAYHLDLALVGVLIAICSAFGLPWLVAATVRSLNHVRSLATTEDVVDKSGVAKTNILHVRENRVTGIVIHLGVAVSLLLLPVLANVPLAALFGLFLYMGIVSMKGNQFFERLSLWATDPSLYPRTHYVTQVPKRTIHGFTLIQLTCLVVLWIVKVSAFGILFPLFIAILVPVRFVVGKVFDREHLELLDAEEHPEQEQESESWS